MSGNYAEDDVVVLVEALGRIEGLLQTLKDWVEFCPHSRLGGPRCETCYWQHVEASKRRIYSEIKKHGERE